MTSNITRLRFFNTEIRQCIFACPTKTISTSVKVRESIYNYQRDFEHTCSQTRSRSLQTWHLLEWDMACWSISWRVVGSLEGRYAQRSDIRSDIKMNQCQTYETVVVTFTLFSHSNSVHMLRNWGRQSEQLKQMMLWTDECTYLSFVTIRRLDVVHDVDVYIIQYQTSLRYRRSFPQDTTKDNVCFRRRHLYGWTNQSASRDEHCKEIIEL